MPYDERKSWHCFWLIDPLDGTREFVNRCPEFTVNVALIKRNRPILGVVYLPAIEELYFGAESCGAFYLRDCRKLCRVESSDSGGAQLIRQILADAVPLCPPRQGQEVASLTIMHSRSHSSSKEEEFIARIGASLGEVRTVPAGSSLKFCRIAQGSGDVYPRFGPTMEWDTAAAQCVVEQAGGEVMDITTGSSLRYNKPELRNASFIVLGARLKAAPGQRNAVLNALKT